MGPALFSRYDFYRALQSAPCIPSRIAPAVISPVDCFLHIGINILPSDVSNKSPERRLDLLLNKSIRRRLNEAVVEMQTVPSLPQPGV